MKEKSITNFSMFALIFIVLTGTTSIYGIGVNTRQDAWLVVLLSSIIFLLFYTIYYSINKNYPDMRLTTIIKLVFGKVLGKIIILLYAVYFLYISARNVSDILHYCQLYILEDTPAIYITILICIITVYALFLDINIIAKSAKYIFIIVISFYIFIILIVLLNDLMNKNINLDFLTPVLEYGWMPIIKATSIGLTIPYGELIVILMIIPYFKNKKDFNKTFISSVIYASLFSLLIVILTLIVIGPDLYNNYFFKFLPLTTGIEIPLLNRVDSILVNMIILGAIYKHIILAYGGVVALQDFFSLKTHKLLIIPSIIMIIIVTIILNYDTTKNLIIGFKIVPYYIHYPMQFGIPLILLIVMLIKKKSKID